MKYIIDCTSGPNEFSYTRLAKQKSLSDLLALDFDGYFIEKCDIRHRVMIKAGNLIIRFRPLGKGGATLAVYVMGLNGELSYNKLFSSVFERFSEINIERLMPFSLSETYSQTILGMSIDEIMFALIGETIINGGNASFIQFKNNLIKLMLGHPASVEMIEQINNLNLGLNTLYRDADYSKELAEKLYNLIVLCIPSENLLKDIQDMPEIHKGIFYELQKIHQKTGKEITEDYLHSLFKIPVNSQNKHSLTLQSLGGICPRDLFTLYEKYCIPENNTPKADNEIDYIVDRTNKWGRAGELEKLCDFGIEKIVRLSVFDIESYHPKVKIGLLKILLVESIKMDSEGDICSGKDNKKSQDLFIALSRIGQFKWNNPNEKLVPFEFMVELNKRFRIMRKSLSDLFEGREFSTDTLNEDNGVIKNIQACFLEVQGRAVRYGCFFSSPYVDTTREKSGIEAGVLGMK